MVHSWKRSEHLNLSANFELKNWNLTPIKKTCLSCLHANGQGNVVGAYNVLNRDSEDFMSCGSIVEVLASQSPDYLSDILKGINLTCCIISTLSFWNSLLIGWIDWNNLASCSWTNSCGVTVSMNHNNLHILHTLIPVTLCIVLAALCFSLLSLIYQHTLLWLEIKAIFCMSWTWAHRDSLSLWFFCLFFVCLFLFFVLNEWTLFGKLWPLMSATVDSQMVSPTQVGQFLKCTACIESAPCAFLPLNPH